MAIKDRDPFAAARPDYLPDAATDEDDDRDGLIVDLDGFEGPIDMLLALARDQKVDLTHISILQLADQYLTFIAQARRVRLELAADYLVMAAWLAYLKSRLLLPAREEDEEPSGPELAEALQFQLRRLEAMQAAGARLMGRPRLGRDVFARGAPEGIQLVARPVYDVALYDLLQAYGEQRMRLESSVLEILPTDLYSVDEALKRLSTLLGSTPDWAVLTSFLPEQFMEGVVMRSAIAATFTASLEMAREGKLKLRQATAFGPLYIRKADTAS